MPIVIRQGRVVATCDVCGQMAHNGYGPMWSCAEHKSEVERQWVAKGSPVK